jgi:hypothetical protein
MRKQALWFILIAMLMEFNRSEFSHIVAMGGIMFAVLSLQEGQD